MKDFSENKKLKIKAVLTGVIMILIGLVLLIFPETSLTTVCFILGIFICIKAIGKLLDYLNLRKIGMGSTFSLISVVATFLLAIVLFIHPKSLISVIPSLIGFAIIIAGISSLTSHRSSKLLAIIEIIIGAVVLAVPFAFASAITAVIGIALIVLGVVALVSFFKYNKAENEPRVDKNGYKEVDFENVDNDFSSQSSSDFKGDFTPKKESETFEEAGIEDAGAPNPSYDNLDFNEDDIKDAEFKDIE